MELQAIIFDVDGTLAETERDGHRVAFNAAFAAAGLPWRWDEALYGRLLSVAGGKERLRAFAGQHDVGFLARPYADAILGALHAAKNRRYQAMLHAGAIPPRPGIARLIDEARAAGVRLAIATTTSPDNVTALLAACLGPESTGWFDVIGAGDAVKKKKPAPDIYRWVLDRLGLPAGACLAVEDSAIGLRAAIAAGVSTLVTVSEYSRGEDFSGALAVLPDLSGTCLDHLQRLHGSLSFKQRAASSRRTQWTSPAAMPI